MKNRKWLAVAVGTLCAAVFLSGCQTLRQKFVRKKKSDKEDKFIPILEPVEYEAHDVSRAERYGHHYQTYRVWERELMAGLERDMPDKRLEFFLNELVTNIEGMIKWAPEDMGDQLQGVLTEYRSALSYFQSSDAFRNEAGLVSKLRRYERDIRRNFSPSKIYPPQQDSL